GGQLVVLECTTYPGTTREILLPRLEAGGLKAEEDFFLAFSPERIDPGNRRFTLRDIPKVVGGLTPACRELAAALYGRVAPEVVPVSGPETAEMVKLFENTFRSVNIALERVRDHVPPARHLRVGGRHRRGHEALRLQIGRAHV